MSHTTTNQTMGEKIMAKVEDEKSKQTMILSELGLQPAPRLQEASGVASLFLDTQVTDQGPISVTPDGGMFEMEFE